MKGTNCKGKGMLTIDLSTRCDAKRILYLLIITIHYAIDRYQSLK